MPSGLLKRVVNSSQAPGVAASFVGVSDWEMCFGEKTNYTTLGRAKHYITTINDYTSIAEVGKFFMPTPQNQNFMLGQMEIDVYNVGASWSINIVDKARIDETLSATNTGGNAVQWFQSLARQGIGQRFRIMGLFGIEAGEGILTGAKQVSLGNDPSNNSKISTMSPDWLGRKIGDIISELDASMLNTSSEIVILTSIEIYNALHFKRGTTSDTIFQGSVVSIADYLKKVVEGTGRKLTIGKEPLFSKADSTKAKDFIFIVAPGLELDNQAGDLSVNQFGKEVNNIPYNTCFDFGQKVDTVFPETYQGLSGRTLISGTCGFTLRDGISVKIEVEY